MKEVANVSSKPRPWLTVERLGAFTDGVIAIIITILVLEIRVPSGHDFAGEGMVSFLEKVGHDVMVYLLSFLLILTYWIQHHVMFHYVARANRTLLLLNGLFLFFLSLSPFTTSMAGEYRGVPIIEVIFGVTYFLSGVMIFSMWIYCARNPYLLRKPVEATVRRSMLQRVLVAPALALVGTALSLVDFHLATIVYFSIPFFYVSHWLVDASWPTEA